jgi:hypothetical protein
LAKYCSAWNAFKKFEKAMQNTCEWSLQEDVFIGFFYHIVYHVKEFISKYSTAKAYITALATAHSIAGLENTAIRPGKLTHLILGGGKNLEITEKTISISMNLSKVKIIGHRIATSKWSPGSKQVIWAAVTIAFFTSARMSFVSRGFGF